MRRPWISAMAAIALAFIWEGCSAPPPSATASFIHLVLYKAKSSPSDSDLDQLLTEAKDKLPSIPTIKGLWTGRAAPLPPILPSVIDGDYDMAMLFVFDSPQGLQDFLDHPNYVEFRKKHADSYQVRIINFNPYGGAARR
jgi:hypothetical protein